MRLKDQTSSNAYIQVQSNLKFKLRFNGKRSFIKETFAREVFLIFFDIVRVINYVSFYYRSSAGYITITLDTVA